MLEQVVELDPDYAAAWAALGLSVGTMMWISPPEDAPALLEQGYPHVRRAVSLDPDSAFAHSLLATMSYPRKDWIQAQVHHERAVSLRRNTTTLRNFANMLMRAGRIDAAQRYYDEVFAAEPSSAIDSTLPINTHLAQSRFNLANEFLRLFDEGLVTSTELEVGLNTRDARLVREKISELATRSDASGDLYRDIRNNFDNAAAVSTLLQRHFSNRQDSWPSKYHDIAMLAAYFGNAELALTAKAGEVRYTPTRQGALWHPLMAEVRKLPGFKDLMHEINIVEYWRQYGWPEACRPRGNNDFTCE